VDTATEIDQTRPRVRIPRGPAVPILLLAGVVHIVRQNLLDVLVFFGTALVIVIDAQLRHRGRSMRILPGRGWLPAAAVGGALLGLAGLGSPVVKVVLAVVGVASMVVVLRGPADRTEPALPPGWRAWATVAVAIAVWELLAWLSQDDPDVGNPDHPTLSTLADPVLASTLGRALMCAAWAAGFVWLLRALATGGADHRPPPGPD
jgi:hypothetical protein